MHIPHSTPRLVAQPGNTSPEKMAIEICGDPEYILLCINTKNSTALAHIETSLLSSDQYLFRQIFDEYQRVRRVNEWRVSSIIPSWVKTSLHWISTRVPSPPSRIGWLLSPLSLRNIWRGLHLHKITSGDFVRFRLIPIREECCPRWFKKRELPPETEVKAGRYRYEPVPMDDVELAEIPLSHLLKPGPHTDRFWITTFPKKLREQLVRRPGADGQRVIGWGIRINEGLNWSYILLLTLILLIVIGLIVIVYAMTTSDGSAAFGLGAFLVAVFTVYSTYQYLAWKEE